MGGEGEKGLVEIDQHHSRELCIGRRMIEIIVETDKLALVFTNFVEFV